MRLGSSRRRPSASGRTGAGGGLDPFDGKRRLPAAGSGRLLLSGTHHVDAAMPRQQQSHIDVADHP